MGKFNVTANRSNLFPEWWEEKKKTVEALPLRIRAMHAAHGLRSAQKCKNCAFFQRHSQAATWFKCAKSKITGGSATDWRANWPACGKFKPQETEETQGKL
jgi:hypothetical protein